MLLSTVSNAAIISRTVRTAWLSVLESSAVPFLSRIRVYMPTDSAAVTSGGIRMTVFDHRRRVESSLERNDSLEIGLLLCAVLMSMPGFLRRGVITAVSNSAGTTPVCSDVLHKAAKMATVHRCIP